MTSTGAHETKIRSLPDASMGEILGLLEVLSSHEDQAELRRLASELQLEDSKLMAVLQGAQCLGLAENTGTDAILREEGKALLRLRMPARKRTVQIPMLTVPFIQAFRSFLEAHGGRAKKRLCLAEISRLLPGENPEEQSRILLSWGRYALVIGYQDDSEEYFLPEEEKK